MAAKHIVYSFVLIICCAFAQRKQVGDSCVVRATGVPGICKIADDCPVVQQQAQNGVVPTLCGRYQLTLPIVCCETTSFVEPNDDTLFVREPTDDIIYPGNENVAPVSRPTSKSEQKCNEYSWSITENITVIPLVTNPQAVSITVDKCDHNSVPLIVGGAPAVPGEFPFMVALGYNTSDKIEWRCGGTLISNNYVLTAAHCVRRQDGEPKVVLLGEIDLLRDDDGASPTQYNIKNIVPHPNHKPSQKYNDIALIELATNVTFTKFIRPACLYNQRHIEQPKAVATGWGKTDYAAVDISFKLMKVSLDIFGNQRCAQTYSVNKNLPRGIVSSMICAGVEEGGSDTCQGDSGGPLVITNKSNQCKFYVIGVTSIGKACGLANTPAIYTRVSEFVPWIEKTIW